MLDQRRPFLGDTEPSRAPLVSRSLIRSAGAEGSLFQGDVDDSTFWGDARPGVQQKPVINPEN